MLGREILGHTEEATGRRPWFRQSAWVCGPGVDAGDFTVGSAAPLLGRRPWEDIAELPIDTAAAGNHERDDGVPALLDAARGRAVAVLHDGVDRVRGLGAGGRLARQQRGAGGGAGVAPGAGGEATKGDPATEALDAAAASVVGENWSRMPAGVSAGNGEPETVAVMPWVVPRLPGLLGRDLVSEPASGGVRSALLRVLA